MSFVIRYLCLFKVTIQEEGSNRTLPGFVATPSAATKTRLADHALIFRAWENGFGVYYQTNPLAKEPLLGGIRARERFSFCLYQSDMSFFERYEPDLTPAGGPQIYLDNVTPTGAIQPAAKETLSVADVVLSSDAIKVYPGSFVVATDLSGAGPHPTKYVVGDKFAASNVVLEVPITATAGAELANTRIDMSGRAGGPYTLKTDLAGAVAQTIYIDDQLTGDRLLGIIDIYWETAQDTAPAGGQVYRIQFRKR
jgi:hypothetical protein